MLTVVKKMLPADTEQLNSAAALIRAGEIVAMPTETVYGLAADAFNPTAVAKIFEAKGRPQDNPLIVHISSLLQLSDIACSIPDSAYKLAERFMPGPLTVILPKAQNVPDCVTAGLDSVAVRMPSHPVASAFISACGTPLAAPSANISGSPSPTSAQHVYKDLSGKIPLIIDGGECSVGVESTVLSLVTDIPQLLRPGAVTPAMLREIIGEISVNPAVLNPLAAGARVESPGMKYKHYSPRARVVLVKGSRDAFSDYVRARADKNTVAIVYEGEPVDGIECIICGKRGDYSSQEHELFGALRKADDMNASVCFAHCPDTDEKSLAVLNRLLRAAAFEIVDAEGE